MCENDKWIDATSNKNDFIWREAPQIHTQKYSSPYKKNSFLQVSDFFLSF
jgi:hypothetical protein